MKWQNKATTQYEADLEHWVTVCLTTTSYPLWRFAQDRVDALWRAMGCAAVSPICRLTDQELIFPAVRAALDGDEDGRRGG